jgi:AcrR family transcriptional regulator
MDDNLILQEPRPIRSDALKNHELLLETAQRLFNLHGVDAVTMALVAETAGVGKGTLYRHFPEGKPQLCTALIDSDQRDLQERTLHRLRTQPDDPLGNLRWFLGEVVAFVGRNRELLFSGVIDKAGAHLAHPAHSWWRQTIRGLLSQLHPSIDIDYASDVLFVMIDPRTIRFQYTSRSLDNQRIVSGLLDVLDHLIS